MPNSVEELLSEIRNEVAKLVTLLEEKPSEPPEAADETLRIGPAAGSDHVEGKLTLFTIIFTVIAAFFLVVGISSIFLVYDAFGKLSELEQKNERIVTIAEHYPNILGDIAYAGIQISEANRLLEARDDLSARRVATVAIDRLWPLLEIGTAVNSSVFKPDTCMINAARVTLSIPGLSLNPEQQHALEDALLFPISEALFAAEDTRTKAIFSGNQAERIRLARDSAKAMIILFGGRPEGYHWMGLIEEEEGDNDDALHCFDKSLHQSGPSKDYINLAELEFVLNHFAESRSDVSKYFRLVPSSDRYATSEGILAQFYESLSAFMLSSDPSVTDAFRRKIDSLKATAVLDSARSRFSTTVLAGYICNLPPSAQMPNQNQRDEIERTSKSLLGKDLCEPKQ